MYIFDHISLSSSYYTLYTADLPTSNKTLLSTFADDTAIFSTHPDSLTASHNLQAHLHNIETWFRKWKLQINENKSTHVTFSLRQGQCPPVYINRLMPNDSYMGRTAPLTSKRCILYIYSENIGTEYFKHAIYSPFFPLQNAVCFIMLTCLVPVLFTFNIQGVLKFKKIIPAPKG